MRVVLFLACVVLGALSAPTTEDPQDPFIALLKELEAHPFFRQMSTDDRVLTFEMVTAAETYNLTPLLNRLGYIRLLKYIDSLPKDFEHGFIVYSLQHLELEASAAASSQS